jgi:large subunit ribosomal protein L23
MSAHQILKKLILTEDSYNLVQEQSTFCFEVPRENNKIEVKKAVEDAFNVKVTSVNTIVTPSKKKTIRGQFGRKTIVRGVKKAFVRVRDEDVSKIPLI